MDNPPEESRLDSEQDSLGCACSAKVPDWSTQSQLMERNDVRQTYLMTHGVDTVHQSLP